LAERLKSILETDMLPEIKLGYLDIFFLEMIRRTDKPLEATKPKLIL
jgi:hypothetical protein